jgi:hypothetical protein
VIRSGMNVDPWFDSIDWMCVPVSLECLFQVYGMSGLFLSEYVR